MNAAERRPNCAAPRIPAQGFVVQGMRARPFSQAKAGLVFTATIRK